jgi:hypothetical protein
VALPAEPAITTGRPAILDQQLRPVAYNLDRVDPYTPVVRAQSPDAAQPLPPGPASSDTPTPLKPEKLNAPRLMPVPQTSTQSNSIAIPNDCGPASSNGSCSNDATGPCCEGGFLPRWCRLCWACLRDPTCEDGLQPHWWLPLWRPGECFNRPYDIWGSGEYLFWWIKNSSVPPLVTTSPVGTDRAMAGVLGTDSTSVLFGGPINNEERSGGRFTLGFWFDGDQTCGLEGSYFFLGQRTIKFADSSSGMPILARPFFDVVGNQEASQLIAFPGVVSGGIAIQSSSRLQGADLNFRTNWWRGCCWRFDTLIGFRYLALNESLNIAENLVTPAGDGIFVNDHFGTQNNFFGGQLGAELELRQARWSLNLLTKVALGTTRENLNVSGYTAFTPAGAFLPTVETGGLLAQPTNSGHFSRDHFAVVPELGVKLGYQATDHIRLTVAYTFLYDSAVLRPGSQIDPGINITQLSRNGIPAPLVGPARPTLIFKDTDFWAQGVSFGLEFRY